MPNYGDFTYWENRYLLQQDCTFDWLEDFDSLRNNLDEIFSDKYVPITNPNILMLGCGNSNLSERMYREMNLHKIFNMDISSNVIKSMRERSKELLEMSWDVMDCRDLKFNQGFFDVVIDKCTMDTILCGDNPYLNVALMTKEVQRVLKASGVYLIISHSEQESRLQHLLREHLSFDVKVTEIKSERDDTSGSSLIIPHLNQTHYIYICKKRQGADSICQENFHRVYYELEKENVLEEDEENIYKIDNQ
jgi:ubiquinone/menaquinone biosynthesis C-methylase UbiE